jgi:predicted nucleic acid-binding protein
MNPASELPEVILCDTTFVSIQERASRDPGSVARWPAEVVGRLDGALLAISVFVLAELRAGRAYAGWGQRRADAQEARLAAYVRVPRDDAVLDEYAALHAWSLKGHRMPHNDMWIAATALARRLPLVSCDRHFDVIAADHPLDHIYLPCSSS